MNSREFESFSSQNKNPAPSVRTGAPERLERSEPFGVKEEQSLFCSSVCRSYKIDAAKKGPRASPAKRVAWGKGAAVEHEKALAFARALESRNLPRRGGQREIRTPGTLLTYTRFPIVRLKPTQPSVHCFQYTFQATVLLLQR